MINRDILSVASHLALTKHTSHSLIIYSCIFVHLTDVDLSVISEFLICSFLTRGLKLSPFAVFRYDFL